MNLLAIDPGPEQSAIVLIQEDLITHKAKLTNHDVFAWIRQPGYPFQNPSHVSIEMIASYGMPVGAEVFETCVWIGRFWQVAVEAGRACEKVYRKDVKLWLCGTNRAKDANVRQALLDKFPRTGGGKTPQIGTKSQPGPLFGFAGDMWAALAVAMYAMRNGDAHDFGRDRKENC